MAKKGDRGQRGTSEEKVTFPVGILQTEGDLGKIEADFPNLEIMLPLHPEFPLNGGVIYGSPEILVKGFFMERNPGIRRMNRYNPTKTIQLNFHLNLKRKEN
jgi:hypothetical protein